MTAAGPRCRWTVSERLVAKTPSYHPFRLGDNGKTLYPPMADLVEAIVHARREMQADLRCGNDASWGVEVRWHLEEGE